MGENDKVLFIPDEKLVDYPGNNEDISYTAELEKSVRECGIIDPLEVIPFSPLISRLSAYDGYYMILNGHRRRTVGRKLGMTEFP